MRVINETFGEYEFRELKKRKGSRTWREFILTLVKGGEKDGK